MNTEKVQALAATATKPATGEGSGQKRVTPLSADAVAPAKEPEIVPQTQKVQQTVAAVAAQIESYLRSNGRNVELSVDSESGETVISVRDASTGELIRQIPSAEALRLSQSIGSHHNSLVDVVV